MWFIGVEVEQETSAPPPKKILDPPLTHHSYYELWVAYNKLINGLIAARLPLAPLYTDAQPPPIF